MRAQFLPRVHRRLTSIQYPIIRNSLPQLRSLLHSKSRANNRTRITPTMAPEMTTLRGKPLHRAELDNLLRRCLFYTPSFEIYGGVSKMHHDISFIFTNELYI